MDTTIILLEECRKCEMFVDEIKSAVRCGRMKDFVIHAPIMPYYNTHKDKMDLIVFCNNEPGIADIYIR